MSILDDLLFASSGTLSIKEEVEINETQLQDQIFDGIRVNQSGETEKRSKIVNGLCHKTEDETISHSETIKEEPCEGNLRPEDHASSVGTYDGTRSAQKKNHTCSVCAKSFSLKIDLWFHMESDCTYACTTCHKKFTSRERLSKHKVIHNPIFKCVICAKFYYSRTKLINHMKFHRGERPFKCEFCPRSFTCKDKLLSHSKTHPVQCEKCKLFFRWGYQYRSHLEANKCQGYAAGNTFQCSKCDNESFESVELLNRHQVEIHPPPEKNEVCSVCAKAFRWKYLLSVHMNLHTGSRPYTCATCSKTFSNSDYLRRHTFRCHKEVTARSGYKCAYCGESFLANHVCEKYFKLEDQFSSFSEDNICKASSQESHDVRENEIWEKQIQTQNEIENVVGTVEKSRDAFEKKYKCDQCNKKFVCKRNLNFHLRSHKTI